MDKYCDIAPHANGWIFILNGVESECSFHTYELAVEAARAHVANEARERVFRRQGLNGAMFPLQPKAFPQGPFIG
jgi:hypothetical protein